MIKLDAKQQLVISQIDAVVASLNTAKPKDSSDIGKQLQAMHLAIAGKH